MKALNPIGSTIITTKDETEILDINKYGKSYSSKYREVTNLSMTNTGSNDLIFKINKGEKMVLKPNVTFCTGSIECYSVIIYTKGANVRWTALMDEPFVEV